MEINERLKTIFYKSAIAATIFSGAIIGIDRYSEIFERPKIEEEIKVEKPKEYVSEGIFPYLVEVEKIRAEKDKYHEESLREIYVDQSKANNMLAEKLDEANKETVSVLKNSLEQKLEYGKPSVTVDELETLHYTIEQTRKEAAKNLEKTTQENNRLRIESEERLRKENETRLINVERQQKIANERVVAEYNSRLVEEKKQLELRLNAERERDKLNFQKSLEETQRADREKQQKLDSLQQQVQSLRNNQSTQYVPQNTPQQSINTNNTTLQRSPTMGSQQTYQTPSSSHSISRGSYNDSETRARIEADLERSRQEMFMKREQKTKRLSQGNTKEVILRIAYNCLTSNKSSILLIPA